jgi:hypothetical protein
MRLTFKHSHTTPDHTVISAARYEFARHCIDSRQPELLTLA